MSANFIRSMLTKLKPISQNNYPKNSLSFNKLLNSCSSLSNLTQIHALILTNGTQYDNLPLHTKLIISSIYFSPNMDYARKLFDSMLDCEKDVFLWNSLMKGYADVGPCQEAITIYRNMHRTGLGPDNYTFPSVLRCCGVVSGFWEGKEVHCHVIKHGFDLDLYVQSSLISLYFLCGEILDSEMVFSEMGVRNTVSWTAMIAGYVQNGLFLKGLCVFNDMIDNGINPNAVTLVSALPACACLGFLSLGKLVHGYGIKLGVDLDVSLMNALIAFYGKCGNVEISRSLFDEMKFRNLVTWNAMVAAYEQNNAAKNAIKLFRRMETEKIDFDYITMVSVISACAALGVLNDAKWVHNIVRKKGFEINISVTNALIDMYAKCGNINLARDVFEKLPNKTIVSWTAMIGACASHGHGQDALNLFSKMKKEGNSKPNSFTFIAVLTACRHSGLVEEGRNLFESMTKDYSITPDVEHCACIVDLLARAGSLIEAYKFIENMPVKPDVGVWGALLAACKIHGSIEIAEMVADRVLSLEPEDVTFYVLMSHIYAEAGRWEDAERLKQIIEERKLEKIGGYSSVEVNRKFHTFRSGSSLKFRTSKFI